MGMTRLEMTACQGWCTVTSGWVAVESGAYPPCHGADSHLAGSSGQSLHIEIFLSISIRRIPKDISSPFVILLSACRRMVVLRYQGHRPSIVSPMLGESDHGRAPRSVPKMETMLNTPSGAQYDDKATPLGS